MIEPRENLRLKLRSRETIRVLKVFKSGWVKIEGPYYPLVRWWTRSEWDIYTLDADRLPDEPSQSV